MRQTVASAAPGRERAARALARVPVRTALTERDSPDRPGGPADNGTYWTPMIYSPVHKVYAGVYMPCGDERYSGLLSTAL